jgi:hypothetical protein
VIIFEPERTPVEDRVRVSARVEFRTPPPNAPAELFFELPQSRIDWLSDRSDAFLLALLLPAMQQGEDVEVRGAVSPRLLLGLNEYQRAFNAWFPWRFQRVAITLRQEAAEVPAAGAVVATAFSGGVDSFYTLWSHLPQNDADPRSAVSAALFVHGFDIPLENERAYREAYDAYDRMFAELGLELVSARTNAQHFTPPRNWGVYHGAPLAAAAHALGRGLGRFYVPASHTYNDLVPWGSDPRVDHLLSSETLQVVHDGAGTTRIAKTEAIGRWPATFGRLRVCAPRADGALANCGRCEKCVRTMLPLQMVRALELQTSFPQRLERRTVRSCYYNVASDFAFPREIIEYARSHGRRDVVVDLTWATARSRVAMWLRPIVRRVREVFAR